MNINNFNAPDPSEMKGINYAEAIFTRQSELIEKYHHIEVNNGFVSADMPTPVNIDDRFAQYRVKDFCWRVTEELMEALEAWFNHDSEHFTEELIDALHFITELSINVGLTPQEIYERAFADDSELKVLAKEQFTCPEDPIYFDGIENADAGSVENEVLGVVYLMGLAANTLKNKPWKQSHVSTDENKFRNLMSQAYVQLIFVLGVAGLESLDIYEIYYKKSEVNKFRQRSNY